MPRKNREVIAMLRNEGMSKSEAEKYARGDLIEAFYEMRFNNTRPPLYLKEIIKKLDRKPSQRPRDQMKVSVQPELVEALNSISEHLKTSRQKIVEILLRHYLLQHGDEAIHVLHCYTEQKANHQKYLSRRKTGYRTEEDNLDYPLGPEYQDPDVHGIYIPEQSDYEWLNSPPPMNDR